MTRSEIRPVSVADLTVDPKVQRQIDPARVRKLAEAWDPKMVGVITASARLVAFDETPDLVVLDGQTRVEAARRKGVPTLMAEVFEGLSPAVEASLFLKHNDRKAVTPRDRFRLSVMAEDEDALTLRDIAAAHGWYVQGVTPKDLKGMRGFQAVTAAERIYALDKGKALRKTFAVIDRAWGTKPGAVSSETLYGLGLLFGEHPTGIDAAGLTHKLGKLGINAFLSAITDRRRIHPGLSIRTASAQWTVEVYNRGRRTHRV